MRNAWRLAVGTLTRVPTPPPQAVDRRTAGRAMLLAPVTAVPPVVALVLLHLAVAHWRLPAFVAAVLLVAGLAWWSRGLHLDGLADTADGFAAGFDRGRALEVMRRGDTGPVGVVTLVLVLLLQAGALAALVPTAAGTAVAALALLVSRQVLALGCSRRVRAARPDGLGAAVAGSVSDAALATSLGAGLVLSTGIGLLAGAPWYAGPVVLLATAGVALLTGRVAYRRLGGVTGDVLGALVETALAAGLIVSTLVA